MRPEDIEAAARGLWAKVGPYDIHTDVEAAVRDVLRNQHEVETLLTWVRFRRVNARVGKTPRSSSYSLKHEVERWCGRWVCHTTFLVIMYDVGIEFNPSPIVRANGLREFHTNLSVVGTPPEWVGKGE